MMCHARTLNFQFIIVASPPSFTWMDFTESMVIADHLLADWLGIEEAEKPFWLEKMCFNYAQGKTEGGKSAPVEIVKIHSNRLNKDNENRIEENRQFRNVPLYALCILILFEYLKFWFNGILLNIPTFVCERERTLWCTCALRRPPCSSEFIFFSTSHHQSEVELIEWEWVGDNQQQEGQIQLVSVFFCPHIVYALLCRRHASSRRVWFSSFSLISILYFVRRRNIYIAMYKLIKEWAKEIYIADIQRQEEQCRCVSGTWNWLNHIDARIQPECALKNKKKRSAQSTGMLRKYNFAIE